MMRCELKARRFCEAKHMVNHDDNTFALHVAMEGVRNLLYDCTVGKNEIYDVERREEIYKHLLDDVHYMTITEEKRRRKRLRQQYICLGRMRYRILQREQLLRQRPLSVI